MLLLSLLLLLYPQSLSLNFLPFMAIWNVGQGQWVTYVEPHQCTHVDVGGEIFPQKVLDWCERKTNFVQISHWDKDHYCFLPRLQKIVSVRLERSPLLSEIYATSRFKDKNSNSKIHTIARHLLTGDSTKKAEKLWLQLIPKDIKVLIVPHHGSDTSSSHELLRSLKHLKMAIVSARKQKYHHPHTKVIFRYKQHQIPLLRTEIWGDIFVVP